MKNIKAIIGIILVFTLGATSGATVTYMVQNAKLESFIKGGLEAKGELFISRLTQKLDLDDQQQAAVRAIVKENSNAIREVRKQYRPQTQAILEQGQARIARILKPEQQEQFRQMIEEYERQKNRPPEGS